METRSALTSLSIHAGVLALLLGLAIATAPLPKLPAPLDPRGPVKLLRYKPSAGGAAANRSPPSLGHPPPRIEARIFVPPQAVARNEAPKLIMTAALDVPPSITVASDSTGDPAGLGKMLSGGVNGHGGIGTGPGTSVGSGDGGQAMIYRAGSRGVTAPVPTRRVEPEYSEEARKARTMGSVLVLVDVGPDGQVHNIRVARGIGMGLDEKAVEAVSQWLFRPGMKDGRPVTVAAQIEVAFHLL